MPDGRVESIQLGAPIGSGATAEVFTIIGKNNIVAKIYNNGDQARIYHQKLSIMIGRPLNFAQTNHNGSIIPQVAWPQFLITDDAGSFKGFAMPSVDHSITVSLNSLFSHQTRSQRSLPDDIRFRIYCSANLAKVTAALHRVGHYVIDMKHINIRVHPASTTVTLLDADGFSIQGQDGRRYPAQHISDEYMAPEAQRLSPDKLGVEQDNFSIAVLIFQLLNNGIHPFQGVSKPGQALTSNQERINAGMYAYGHIKDSRLSPTPTSVHEFFDATTRAMFDRAFKTGKRPTAQEWERHLLNLLPRLKKCGVNPNHVDYGVGCGQCAVDAKIQARATGGMNAPTPRPPSPPTPPPPPPPPSSALSDVLVGLLFAFARSVVFPLLMWLFRVLVEIVKASIPLAKRYPRRAAGVVAFLVLVVLIWGARKPSPVSEPPPSISSPSPLSRPTPLEPSPLSNQPTPQSPSPVPPPVIAPRPSPPPSIERVRASQDVYMRAARTLNSRILKAAREGESFVLVSPPFNIGGWNEVRDSLGETGYIYGKYLEKVD